jgi:Helix-turn-helix domain
MSWPLIRDLREVNKVAAGLTPTQTLVLSTLALHCDKDGLARPSQERLIQETGLSERTIRRASGELRERGLLAVRYGSQHSTPHYRLNHAGIVALPRVQGGHHGPPALLGCAIAPRGATVAPVKFQDGQRRPPEGPPCPSRGATVAPKELKEDLKRRGAARPEGTGAAPHAVAALGYGAICAALDAVPTELRPLSKVQLELGEQDVSYA